MPEATTLGAEFARALAGRDSGRLLEILAPEIDFQAITPRRTWQAADPEEVLSIIFGKWFEDSDEIQSLEAVDTDGFADRQRVRARRADRVDARALLRIPPGPIASVARQRAADTRTRPRKARSHD